MSFYAPNLTKDAQARARGGAPAAGAWPAVLACAAAAILIQSLWIPIDADVSWLITVCERVLAGDRLYVDILEVNPPASVWLYLPLVWLAGVLAVKPEAVVAFAFVLGPVASIWATLRLTAQLRDPPERFWLAIVLALVTLVLPMALFAQREHAALLLSLPAVATLALVASHRSPGRAALIASGVAAGLVIVIKPYFLTAILFPAAWAAWKRRSLLPLLSGIAAAAAVVAAYGLAIFLFAGPYLDWLPVIAHTYSALHSAWWKILIGPALYPMICLGLAILLRPPRVPPLVTAWALAGAGFLAAAYVQAKNYPNHWYPQAGLALVAATVLATLPSVARARRMLVAAGLAVVGLCEAYYWTIVPDPAVAAEIERLAPGHPRIIALSPQLTTGHPVTRNVGGRWVGSRAGLFTASGARVAGLDDPVAAAAYREDILSFTRDVRSGSPDVVLVYRPSKAWLMREPTVRATMRSFVAAASVGDAEIWIRKRAG